MIEADGIAVVRSTTIGDTLARLRLTAFDVVVVIARNPSESLESEYRVLVDDEPSPALPSGHGADYKYVPAPLALRASLIVLVRSNDPRRVRAAVRQALAALGR